MAVSSGSESGILCLKCSCCMKSSRSNCFQSLQEKHQCSVPEPIYPDQRLNKLNKLFCLIKGNDLWLFLLFGFQHSST